MENSQDIRTLQIMLRVIASTTHEIPLIIPDGIYGRQTAASVRAFQEAAGLPITGKVDERTWQNIIAAYEILAPRSQEPSPLRIMLEKDAHIGPDTSGGHTYLIQAMLLMLSTHLKNIPSLTVNGNYDAATERSVKALQALCDIPETGVIDRRTWHCLSSLYRLVVGNGNL